MSTLFKFLIAALFGAGIMPLQASEKENLLLDNSPNNIIIYKKGTSNYLKVDLKMTLLEADYYILDQNRSIVAGGKLLPYRDTILLNSFPPGNYTIKFKDKTLIALKTFHIN